MSDVAKGRCIQCAGAEAAAMWEAWPRFAHVADVVEESHFSIRIKACGACGQRWVSVFTETIDWVDGDDPQYWSLLPVTEREAEELVALGEAAEERIVELGRDRRYLQADHPKGKEKRILWAQGGLLIGPHD